MRSRILAALLSLHALSLTAAITGTIVAPDGTPLRGVRVQAFTRETPEMLRARVLSASPDRKPLASVESDEKGAFSIDVATPVVDLTFETTGRTAITFEAANGEVVDPVVLREAKPVRGKVTARGKPVSGALILHFANLVTRSDANGDFTLPGGTRVVRVIHPSYAHGRGTVRNSVVNVSLADGVKLQGKVIGDDGKPVANATVSLDGWPFAQSGEDGSFVIDHATTQWQSLAAQRGALAGAIAYRARGDNSIRVSPAPSVTGVARDAAGNALPGAMVLVTSQGGSYGALADAKGRYAIEGVVPRGYFIRAERAGFFNRGAELKVASAPVERNLTLTPLAQITGVVVDEEKKPVGAVEVEAQFVERPAITDANGRFRIRTVTSEDMPQRFITLRKTGYALTAQRVATDSKPVTLVLTRGFPFEISVIDQNRRAVADEPVMVSMGTGDEGPRFPVPVCIECRTNEKGALPLRLTEGTYMIAVGGSGAVMQRFPSEHITAERKQLVVNVQRAVTVTGRVVNADGTPATAPLFVGLAQSSEIMDSPTQTQVSEDGTFTLSGVPAGRITLVASLRMGAPVFGPPVEVNAPASDVEVTAPKLMTVGGRVIDKSTSQPVRDFSVTLRRYRGFGYSTDSPQSVHDENGQFAVDRVPAGTQVDLVVTAPGYARAVVGNVTGTDNEVRLERGASLRVHVTGNGRPVSQARVFLESEPGSPGASVMMTDDDGNTMVDSLNIGDYVVVVSKRGFATARKKVQIADPKETPFNVELDAGRQVSGVVVDDRGQPVASARVDPSRRGGPFGPSPAITDASGSFTLEGLEEGTVTLVASKRGFVNARLEDVDPASAGRVTLTLKRGGTITGHVTGLAADELPRVRVVANGPSTRAETQPDSTGNFKLEGVADERVNVSAMVMASGSSRNSNSQAVQVSGGSAPPVELEFKEGFTVRGRVTRSGEPVAGVAVTFMPRAVRGPRREMRAMTTGDGRYEIAVSDTGEYGVTVMGRGPYDAGVVNVSGSTTYDIDMRGATVRGRVIDAETRAGVSGAILSVNRKGGMSFGPPIVTDSDGRFTVDQISAGTYDLRANKSHYAPVTRTITVGDNDAQEIEIAFERGQQLAVRVIDEKTGRPVDRMAVSVRKPDRSVVYNSSSMADENGVVTFSLDAGQYKLFVNAADYGMQIVDATVPGPEVVVRMGRPSRVVVEGSVAGALSLRLVSATGDARYGAPPPPSRFENVSPGSYRLEVVGAKGAILATKQVVVTGGSTTTVALQ